MMAVLPTTVFRSPLSFFAYRFAYPYISSFPRQIMPKRFEKAGTTYILGLNAEDNWRILAAADKSWWWVHLEGAPSAHVIIEIDVEPLQDELDFAKELILNQTPKAPRLSNIVYAEVRRLRRGTKVGEVVITRS
jgi:hypothetical protein